MSHGIFMLPSKAQWFLPQEESTISARFKCIPKPLRRPVCQHSNVRWQCKHHNHWTVGAEHSSAVIFVTMHRSSFLTAVFSPHLSWGFAGEKALLKKKSFSGPEKNSIPFCTRLFWHVLTPLKVGIFLSSKYATPLASTEADSKVLKNYEKKLGVL